MNYEKEKIFSLNYDFKGNTFLEIFLIKLEEKK
jgi:hypothetical protein